MAPRNLHKCFVIVLLATLAGVLWLGTASGQRRTGRPQPKDDSQEPDKRESQTAADNEFRATPTFFAATSDKERCTAIDM